MNQRCCEYFLTHLSISISEGKLRLIPNSWVASWLIQWCLEFSKCLLCSLCGLIRMAVTFIFEMLGTSLQPSAYNDWLPQMLAFNWTEMLSTGLRLTTRIILRMHSYHRVFMLWLLIVLWCVHYEYIKAKIRFTWHVKIRIVVLWRLLFLLKSHA